MSKILIIGVGGAGRKTVKHMKDIGIPEADYITFNGFDGLDEANQHGIPHYNLIKMNGLENISYTNNPKVYAELAKNVENDIREILEYHLNESKTHEEEL